MEFLFRTSNPSLADETVYITEQRGEADDEVEFVSNQSQADKVVTVTSQRGLADRVVYSNDG